MHQALPAILYYKLGGGMGKKLVLHHFPRLAGKWYAMVLKDMRSDWMYNVACVST